MSKTDPNAFSLPVLITVKEEGETRTIEYSGERPLTIGRADTNEIVLRTNRASRQHAEIIGEGGRFTLLDLGSRNGTQIEGEPVTQARLRPGARIQIGPAEILFGRATPAAPGRSRRSPASTASVPTAPALPSTSLPSSPQPRPTSPTSPPSPTEPKSAARGTVNPPVADSSPPAPTSPALISPAPRPRRRGPRTSPARWASAGLIGIVAIVGIVWAVQQLLAPPGGGDPVTPVAADSGPDRSTPDSVARSGQDDPRVAQVDGTAPRGGTDDGEGNPSTVRTFDPPPISRSEDLAPVDDEPYVPVRTPRRTPEGDDWAPDPNDPPPPPEKPRDWIPNPYLEGGDEPRPEVDVVPTPEALLSIIPDAWPPGARTIGYEFNQKNHNSAPDFVERKGPDVPERNAFRQGPRYRVIGVEVRPGQLPPGTKLRVRSAQIPARDPVPLPRSEGDAPDRIRKYFALPEPEDRRVVFELLDENRVVLATAEATLPEGGRTTPLATEAIAVMEERQREEWERSQLAVREVTIEVIDDLGRPVPDARVLLLIEGGGLTTFVGTTDVDGRCTRAVIPGSYTVLVHADVPEPIDPDAPTIVKRLPRLLSLQARLGAQETRLRLEPKRSVVVKILDEGEKALPIEKIWVTPAPIAEAYRYEAVAQQVGVIGRLESTRDAEGALLLLLGDLPVDLGLLGRTDDGEPVLITERVTPTKDEIAWAFRRDRFARVTFDPESASGGATGVSGEIAAVGRYRERFRFDTEGAWSGYLMPGSYRLELAAKLPNGGTARFIPYSVDLAPGMEHSLTPRAPWAMTLYQKRKDRQQQFWLAVRDAGGRILDRAPGEPGRIRGLAGETAKIDRELDRFRWQVVERLLGLDLGKLRFETEIPYGNETLRGLAEIAQLQVFNEAGSSSRAPGVFERRILAILREIKRTVEGSWNSLGLPNGLRRIHLELDIFLPPGIGGTGGGGVITLDSQVMHRYAHEGDLLPGAYRHEYGHNLGFGHDPYMMLAEGGSATDEELFGTLAFRLLHAATFQRTIDHLVEDRTERGFSWRPSAAVFPALRGLFGPDVHRRMIEERRASEQTLRLHGLSSIERIAALYSLVLDRNIAWIFRAHGWPVFDHRIDLGGRAVKFMKRHPKELNYTHVPGTEILSWWVLDIDGGEAPLEWQRVIWPTANIDLAIDGQPSPRARRWLLFRRVVVPEQIDARILCASDVQLEVRVNGSAIGVFDASPQQFQPAHDELMLNQKRPLPVIFPKGESFIEIAVNQPPGSRGFVLGLATPEGDPLRLALGDDAPPGEETSSVKPIRVPTKPVLTGEFEADWNPAWIEGATEPRGALAFTIDEKDPALGDSSLRVELLRPGSGAIIQRVFIPPGKTYRLRAAIRSEGLAGEAFVGLFTGELGGWFARTEPLKKASSPWKAFESRWSPGQGRVVYVACYVKGTRGRVWFDGIQLEEQ